MNLSLKLIPLVLMPFTLFGQLTTTSKFSMATYKEIPITNESGNDDLVRIYYGQETIDSLIFVSENDKEKLREKYILMDGEIQQVNVETIKFNRPKFWTRQMAESSGDSEWFDPEKSKTDQDIYIFSDGKLKSWREQSGKALHSSKDLKDKELMYQGRLISFMALIR